MIFASDLDRTLIYSAKFIDSNMVIGDHIKLVEQYNGKDISYMKTKSIELLKDINSRLLFVPVTTRTINQYKRINIFNTEFNPRYAITSNGGNILMNDELDMNWNLIIKNKMINECESLDNVLKEFKRSIADDLWIKKINSADDLFIYSIVDLQKIPCDDIQIFEKWLISKNWRIILNGRKLYFIPNCINKRDAVKYIADREEIELIISAGDSILDYEMLEISNHFISPLHGELNKQDNLTNRESIYFTEKEGFEAAIEMLQYVQKLI